MLLYNGKEVGASGDKLVSLTQAEYDALSDEEKNNGDAYFITDSTDAEYRKLLHISDVIGSKADLAGFADGTIIGAIKDLYERLGGVSFKVEAGTNYLQAIYNDEPTDNVSTLPPASEYMSDTERIEYLGELIGQESDLASTGHGTIIGAILGLYSALGGFSFAYNEITNSVDVSYDDGTDDDSTSTES